ncbi:hypothetical protein QAD02_015376 [Eretmocerus hayati]|uniref:Uncharacterized protein n=1 Tax=Eretmocerus hayati TaxID=131215 RepID=A0ACC2P8H6_9HYME|nr:hypothetical protein QAD02_015376 [Eretmocerus hayati]
MTKTKKKNAIKPVVEHADKEEVPKVPIENLPENYLWMHVKSGTKMRNVLRYALDNFSKHSAVVWTAVGEGIGKGISCAEFFKRKHPGLHQMTKVRYVVPNKDQNQEKASNQKRIPEIHILLSKESSHIGKPGYQGPADIGQFEETESDSFDITSILSKRREDDNFSGRITNLAAEEFAAMGLRTGQKRTRKDLNTETPSKKNKKKETRSQKAE